jgi:hypothetical protein
MILFSLFYAHTNKRIFYDIPTLTHSILSNTLLPLYPYSTTALWNKNLTKIAKQNIENPILSEIVTCKVSAVSHLLGDSRGNSLWVMFFQIWYNL